MRTHNEESYIVSGFLRPILFGLLVGSIGFAVCLFLLAAIGSSMDIPPAWIVPLAVIAVSFAAFVGGFVSGRIAQRNGWLVGAITSLVLFGLSTLSGLSLYTVVDGGFLFVKAAIMTACGLVGGMIAVNLKTKRKKR